MVAYADHGWAVSPCHGIDDHRRCDCGDAGCSAPGKHPCTKSGFKDATSDPEQIERWAAQYPTANWALATGAVSGVFVIDVDPRNGGDESLDAWETERPDGPLSKTMSAATGGGGRHLFFRYVEGVRSRADWLPGVDVKSDDGYVVLPPSRHASGGAYEWLTSGLPEAEPPNDVISDLASVGERRTAHSKQPPPEQILAGVAEGERDDTLFRHACQLLSWGYRPEHVRALILQAAAACSPPFPVSEAERKVEQALKYAEGDDAEGRSADSIGFNMTDDGNALRFTTLHGDDVRHVGAWGWVVWDGRRWVKDDANLILHLARQVPSAIYAEADRLGANAAGTLRKWAMCSEAAHQIRAMLELARADRRISARADEFDTDASLLSCQNGVVDLRTGELRRHSRELLQTRATEVTYEPNYRHKRWDDFIESITAGDPDKADYLRRAAGYSMIAEDKEEAFFIVIGPKA